MLVNTLTTIKWNKNNKKYYSDLGYEFTKYEDDFTVKVKDISKGSTIKIKLKCDECELINDVRLDSYVKSNSCTSGNFGYYLCKECAGLKKTKTHAEFRNEMRLINKNILILGEYTRNDNYILVKNQSCGHAFSTTPARLLKGLECKICSLENKVDRISNLNLRWKTKQQVLEEFNEYVNKGMDINPTSLIKNNKSLYIAIRHFYDNYKQFISTIGLNYEEIIVNELWDKEKTIEYFKKYYDTGGNITPKVMYENNGKLMSAIRTYFGSYRMFLEEIDIKFEDIKADVKGRNRYNWKGNTEIRKHLRSKLNMWKKDSMIKHNYKCHITNDRFDVIHHLQGFDLILDELFEETGLEIKEKIELYSDEELQFLESKCIEIHYRYPLGVCLRKDIHELFHIHYGYGGNTPNQYEEFKERYENGWSLGEYIKQDN